ncbi:MAG: ligase-associated DNA damage response endonuclease PdeM [Hyphomicrobiales bacterium]|nr:ligase-associated DNA damage response endonuclease PdeM [Alphaproteobacteria bacterium]
MPLSPPTAVALPASPAFDGAVAVAGAVFVADPAGVIYWPEQGLLAVADLHFEKGSSFAERGVMLPPYDTAATLARLSVLIAHYAPRAVVALGDSFHDRRGPARLADTDRATLRGLQRGRDWIWITGNHDPEPAEGIGGRFTETLKVGALTFRHQPEENASAEIAGHLHPVARVSRHGRAVSRRCFACDGDRMVMPAFGAYAGGLNIRDRAFARVFQTLRFTAHMLGQQRVYPVAAENCQPD